jgi:uncharacterized protein YbbK (DUF523 family)
MKKKRNKWGTLKQYKNICAEIFEERFGRCGQCQVVIGEPHYHNFHHTQGRTVNFLNKSTIELLCFKHHNERHGIKVTTDWLK